MESRTKPLDYALCNNSSCAQKDKCLRYIFFDSEAREKSSVRIISPYACSTADQTFKFFAHNEKVKIGWGMKKLLDDVPSKKATAIRDELINIFNRPKYYRLRNAELPITPKIHEQIKSVFKKHEVEAEPSYDEISEDFVWE